MPVPVFTGSEIYMGVNASYAFRDDRSVQTSGNNGPGALIAPADTGTVRNGLSNRRPGSLRIEQEGRTGGGIVDNCPFTSGFGIVAGIEVDARYPDLDRTRTFAGTPSDPSAFRRSLDCPGTVRGRLGNASDRFLVFGTAASPTATSMTTPVSSAMPPPGRWPIRAATARSRPALSTAAASTTSSVPTRSAV